MPKRQRNSATEPPLGEFGFRTTVIMGIYTRCSTKAAYSRLDRSLILSVRIGDILLACYGPLFFRWKRFWGANEGDCCF